MTKISLLTWYIISGICTLRHDLRYVGYPALGTRIQSFGIKVAWRCVTILKGEINLVKLLTQNKMLRYFNSHFAGNAKKHKISVIFEHQWFYHDTFSSVILHRYNIIFPQYICLFLNINIYIYIYILYRTTVFIYKHI